MKRGKEARSMKYVGLVVVLASMLIVGAQLAWAAGANPTRLVFAQGTDAETLDPHSITSSPNAIPIMAIYDTLVKYDNDLNIVPSLATDWTVSEDGLTMTFHLRKNVKFQDGTPFNADAVVFNIERLLDPNTRVPLRTYISFVKSAKAIDDYTVEFTLKYSHAPALARLTAPLNSMASPTAIQKYGKDFGSHPVGTGPFKFVEWVKDDHILLAKNDSFWGKVPAIDELMIRVIPDDESRVLALESGQVDVTVRVPPLDVPRLKGEGLNVIVAPDTRVMYIGMNTQYEMLKDQRVRQALNYAVNKEAIVQVLLQGYAHVMDSPLTPESFAYKSTGQYKYDPAKAKQLLAEAGYPNGFELTLMTPHGRYLMDYRVSEAVQGYLAKVGITLKVKEMEWATYISTLLQPLDKTQLQLFLLGWGPWILDPDQMLYPLFDSAQWPPNGFATAFYKNDTVDELLKAGTSTTDSAARGEAYGKAETIIWDEAPWIFMYQNQQVVATSANVKGVRVLPIEVLDFSDAEKN